jgi:hypothetical protein
MNSEITNWLLAGPSWVQYRTQLDLLSLNSNSKKVKYSRAAMLADPKIQNLIGDCAEWDR